MNAKRLIDAMIASAADVPARAEVIALRQYKIDELEQRAKRLLTTIGEATDLPFGRTDWIEQRGQTDIRLPLQARARLYHASGAMTIVMGIKPMESLFSRGGTRETLVNMVEETVRRMNLHQFLGQNESLRFERLWSIKAGAASREGKAVEPILCRVVGAYRHFVGELPVWGAASVALKLANDDKLDSFDWHVRESIGEVIDHLEILRPEQAARQITLQLQTQMRQSKINLDDTAKVQWLRFGYLSLPKRKAQSLLAPVYIAAISIEGQREAQGYIFAVPATEKVYLPLGLPGSEAPPVRSRRE